MGKKIIVVLLVLCIATTFMILGYKSKPIEIVFLGDSIAEGIAGMKPISERDNYAYFGIIGSRNNYIFRNRAVSGHRTSALLNVIKRPDTGAKMTQTHIRNADIIHVSILGNDLLLNDLGQIMIAAAQNDFTMIDSILVESRRNFDNIVSILRAYNPDAVLFFQNVYNPVFPNCWLISQAARAELSDLGVNQSEYRELAAIVISRLNSVITDYLEAHPNEFYLIDSYKAFDDIYKENPQRGKNLIFVDDVHPSFEGHAVMADLIQSKLEDIGMADREKAIKNYKKSKKEQLKRLYKDTIDVDTVCNLIDSADSCEEITEVYFSHITNKQPVY